MDAEDLKSVGLKVTHSSTDSTFKTTYL